jgi:hypothetical protein
LLHTFLVAGWGMSGSICLVRWFEVSKQWEVEEDEAQEGR